MARKRQLLMLEKPGTILEVPRGVVCNNARFIFDHPITLKQGDKLELIDGQFWLLAGPNTYMLEGKWAL